ncbi:MAG TPA: glycosyltransferase family 4 protein [Gemmatimonadaceae bacterium]|nr:glycosyltransferase family 4 protein [Gemmatimonadaceae bacterium]
MRASLLFVNQHYTPDVAATGQCLADLAEHLVREGYDVEVMASRTRYSSGQVSAPAHEIVNGVRVTRLSTTGFGRATHIGRIVDYASFYLKVLGALLFGPRYDGVVFLTTPPLISLIGRIARLVRGQRYGIWSMDLHPEAEVAAGMLRERSLVARVLAWLDERAYRGADFVVDLGAYMQRRVLAKGVEPSRAHTVHIWGGKSEIAMPSESNPLTSYFGLEDKFVVMYSGNAGVVHEFGAVFEAMRALRDDPRIYFLFVGGGPRRAEVEAFAARERLTNVAYHDYVPRHMLPHSLSVADVHLISLRREFVGISVPSKLYGAMGSSRPILFVGPEHCETADAIRDAACGIVVDPTDDGLANAGHRIAEVVRSLADSPRVVADMGARGREVFVSRYESGIGCAAFDSVIRHAWGLFASEPDRAVARSPRNIRTRIAHLP